MLVHEEPTAAPFHDMNCASVIPFLSAKVWHQSPD